MRRGLLVNLGLAAGVSAVFLAALEGLARVWAPSPPEPRDVAEYIWDWDHMMPGGFYVMRSRAVGWPPWEEFNNEGVRDRTRSREKPEGVWRIAVLGDSVTLGAGIQPLEAYPRVLEARLHGAGRRIELMSVALWGWSTRQERIAWHRIARAYQPDQAILAVCLNDIPELHNNLTRPPRWVAWLHERSALVRLLVRAEGREIEDVERLFASPDSARVRDALEGFFDEVRTLRHEVEADGARFAVIVFPFRFQLEEEAPPPVVQERIAAFCQQEGLACLDLLPTLRRMGPEAFLDYDHLSVPGSALTADTLQASELMPEGFSHLEVLREHFDGDSDPGALEVGEWVTERTHLPTDAGVGVLKQALTGADAEVRMAAAWALESVAPAAWASAVGPLARALKEDPSAGVRAVAARSLGAFGERASGAGLGGRADGRGQTDDEGGRDRPRRGGPGPRDAIAGFLFDALSDASEAVRHAAADALFAAGVEEGDRTRLVGALGSDDPYVRGFAAWSLGNLGAAAGPAVPALVATLGRPETEAAVISTLARIGPAAEGAVPALVGVLRSDDADRRWRAARTLGRIGSGAREATPDLIAALGDADGGVRRHAARALGRVATADGPAPAALQRATGDRDQEVRIEAHRALDRLSARSSRGGEPEGVPLGPGQVESAEERPDER